MKALITIMVLIFLSPTVFSNYNPNRALVKSPSLKIFEGKSSITKVKPLFNNWYVVYTKDVLNLERELKSIDSRVIIERDYKSSKRTLPETRESYNQDFSKAGSFFNDPNAARVWSFEDANNYGISIDRAYRDLSIPYQQEIIVAVVDTGIDYNHEDLKNVMWTNSQEIPGNGIDDDNNGYIDDIHGLNTLKRDSEGNATGDMMDTHSHGTHVAGTIGAEQNNDLGIAGIAGNVKLMGIRTVPNSGDELDVDVIEAFLYAAKNGARVINCSFGKDRNEGGMAVKEAIDFIGQKYKTLVVAAAGNSSRDIDSRPTYPASFNSENLLVVASTTSRGRLSYFSNYGSENVDLAAPGSDIYSTVPRNGYGSKSGTSMASPTTAGVAAEVLSKFPQLTPREVKEVLMKTVTKSRRIRRSLASQGRIDLYNALNSLH